jgi:multimeric flavodoxin WrbA
MTITILNGSPKGDQSVTMQYIAYLKKNSPEHQFVLLNVAANIRRLENDINFFNETMEKIRSADAVIWAFPVYILLVSSQYKRFIELVFEREEKKSFSGKPVASFSTSIKFYDNMAHQYIRSISDDLGMCFTGFYSAHMEDLMSEQERIRFLTFFNEFMLSAHTPPPVIPTFAPIIHHNRCYTPEIPVTPVVTKEKKIAIITDCRSEDKNLKTMITRITDILSGTAVTVTNLRELNFSGGCLGCLRCGFDNHCAYEGKDDFIRFYNTIVKQADILIFAGKIINRQMSAVWRRFFDRSFFNNHTPTLINKQIAFFLSGPLRQLPELRRPYEVWMEIQQANLVDFISDDVSSNAELDAAINHCARRLVFFAEKEYVRPRTFYGIAGMKLFRDEIWGNLRFVFRADHKAYKRMKLYDFPQKKIIKRLKIFIATLITGLPMIKSHFPGRIKSEMLKPYQKVLNETR